MQNCKNFFIRSRKFFLAVVICFLCSCASQEDQKQIAAAFINTNLGLYYLQSGNIEEAKEKLLLALKQNPKDCAANDAMAYFLERTGNLKDAERYYLRAIDLSLRNGVGIGASQNNYGTYLYRRNRFSEAMNYFVLATKDPNYLSLANAYKNAGLAALKLNDQAKSNEFFRKAKLNNPSIALPR